MGSTQLHAHHIRAGIDPQAFAHKDRLHLLGKRLICTGSHHTRGDAAADLLCVGRSGEGDDGSAGLLRHQLAHPQAGAVFDALGHGDQNGIRSEIGCEGARRGAHRKRRRSKYD